MAVIGRILCEDTQQFVAPKTKIIGPPIGSPQAILCYNTSDNCSYLFDASGSLSGVSGEPSSSLQYQWDFGDGTVLPFEIGNSIVSHSYSQEGTYTITVTVKDGNGKVSSATITISYIISDPVAILSYSRSGDCQYSFDASNSINNACAGNLSFLWEFGDGDTSTEVSPTHTYANDGSYVVRLTVTDSNNRTNIDSATISVSCDDPGTGGNELLAVINYAADETRCIYNFDGTQSVNEISYFWEFGDGTTSNAASPSKTFTQSGSYAVRLTVTDVSGNTDSATVTIVCDPPAPITIINYSCGANGCTFNLNLSKSINNVPNENVGDLTFRVDWGDGQISTINPGGSLALIHTYSVNSTYTITVTATDSNGKTHTDTVTVTANCVSTGEGPVAAQNQPTIQNNTVTTDGTPSYAFDTDGEEDEYKWTVTNAATGEVYAATNFITPSGDPDDPQNVLEGQGQGPSFDAIEAYRFLCNDAPTANFTSIPGNGGLYTFDPSNSSANGCPSLITGYLWTFYNKEGSIAGTSTDQFPTFNYTSPGTYPVVLRVTTDCGEAVITNFVTVVIQAGAVVDANNPNSIRSDLSGGPAARVALDIDGDGSYEYTSPEFELPATPSDIPHTGVQQNGSIISIEVLESLGGNVLEQDVKRRPTPSVTSSVPELGPIIPAIGANLSDGNAININTSGSTDNGVDISNNSNFSYTDIYYKGARENGEILFYVEAKPGDALFVGFGPNVPSGSESVIEGAISGNMNTSGYTINKEVIFDELYTNSSVYQGHPYDKRFPQERSYSLRRTITRDGGETSDPTYLQIPVFTIEETHEFVAGVGDTNEKPDVIFFTDYNASAIREVYRSSGYVKTSFTDLHPTNDLLDTQFISIATDEESANLASDTVRIYAVGRNGSGDENGQIWEGEFGADNADGTVNVTWTKSGITGLGGMHEMFIHPKYRLNNRPIIFICGASPDLRVCAYNGSAWVTSSDSWFTNVLLTEYPGKTAGGGDALMSMTYDTVSEDLFISMVGQEEGYKGLGLFRLQFSGDWAVIGDVTTAANYPIAEVVIDFNDGSVIIGSGQTILGPGNQIAGTVNQFGGLSINPSFTTRNGFPRILGCDRYGSGLMEVTKFDGAVAGDASDYVLNLLNGGLNNVGPGGEGLGRDAFHNLAGAGAMSKVDTNIYIKPEVRGVMQIQDIGVGAAGVAEWVTPAGHSPAATIRDNKMY